MKRMRIILVICSSVSAPTGGFGIGKYGLLLRRAGFLSERKVSPCLET